MFAGVFVDHGEQHVGILHASWRPAAGWAHQRHPHETGAVQRPHSHWSVAHTNTNTDDYISSPFSTLWILMFPSLLGFFFPTYMSLQLINASVLLVTINKLMSFVGFPGLMYVIETQKVLDLKVNLMASYVIVPQTGFYSGTQNILLLDLGHFKVREGAELERDSHKLRQITNNYCSSQRV